MASPGPKDLSADPPSPRLKRDGLRRLPQDSACVRRPHGGVDPPCGATAELQPVFAVAFLVVMARGTVESTEAAMTMVVAMPAAYGVFRRRKVAHWDFLRFLFVHITFLR